MRFWGKSGYLKNRMMNGTKISAIMTRKASIKMTGVPANAMSFSLNLSHGVTATTFPS